ncbi:MAG: hypothetical protein V1644_02565 [Candidatus Micrarchaeota archaeon]
MPMRLLKPRIIDVVDKLTRRKPKTLLDYANGTYGLEKHATTFGDAISKVVSDHEIKLLIFWALISPTAGIAYLIWVKYPEYRLFAVPLFLISFVQFIGQWGGLYWALQRMGIFA